MAPTPEPFRLDPIEDQRLVDRCLTGDRRAWEQLVARHERLVYAVIRSYRLSEIDQGDVFQEVFAALVRGLPRLREGRALVRWLSSTTQRIARATALRRRRELALEVQDPAGVPDVPAGEAPVGTDLEHLEEQALVRSALAALPERCRNLLHALYYEDPTPPYAELSARIGIPIGSIGPTRARCFERLRDALNHPQERSSGINPGPESTFSNEPRRSKGTRLHSYTEESVPLARGEFA